MAQLQYHPLTLPGGRVYPPVQIRPFGSPDVERYDRVKRQGSEAALRSLIGETLQGVHVDDLYEPDFLHCMMWHRVNSFPIFPLKLPWKCTSCETDNSDTLDLTKLISDELPEEYDANGVTIEYPCGIPLTTRLPKVGDEAKARSLLSSLGKGNANQAETEKAEILQLFEYDRNFNGTEKFDIINKAFTVEDFYTIDAFKREFNYGPRTVQKCTCSHCGNSINVGFRFSLLEFLPSDLDRSTFRTRILPYPASADAAKRAKNALIQKVAVAPTQASEDAGRTSEAEAETRGIDRSSETEIQGASQSHETRQKQVTVGNGLDSPNGPAVHHPNPGKFGGPPGAPITPQMSSAIAAQLVEAARIEAEPDTQRRDGQRVTPAQVLDPNK